MPEQLVSLEGFFKQSNPDTEIYPDITLDTEISGTFGVDIFREIILKEALSAVIEKYHPQLERVKIAFSKGQEQAHVGATFNRGKVELWVKIDLGEIEKILHLYLNKNPTLIDKLSDYYGYALPKEGIQILGKSSTLSLYRPSRMAEVFEESEKRKTKFPLWTQFKNKIARTIAPQDLDKKTTLPNKSSVGASYRRIHEKIIAEWRAKTLPPEITSALSASIDSLKTNFEHELLHLQFFNERKNFGYSEEDIAQQDEVSKKITKTSSGAIEWQLLNFEDGIIDKIPLKELQQRQHELAEALVMAFVRQKQLLPEDVVTQYIILAQAGLEEVFNLIYTRHMSGIPLANVVEELKLFFQSDYSNRTLFPDPQIIDLLEKEGFNVALEKILELYQKENVLNFIEPLTASQKAQAA